MQMKSIETPRTASDRSLQAVKPTDAVDGASISVSNVAVTTTERAQTTAVYVYATNPIHIRFSVQGDVATVNNAPVPAQVPMVFCCSRDDKISMIKMSGAADADVWIMRVEEN